MNTETMECNMNALEKRETIEKGITIVQTEASDIVIRDSETYLQAGALLVGIKVVKKNIEEYFLPLKSVAHKSWKQICDRERQELDKINPAIKTLDKKLTGWYDEQEKLREAEEARLRQEAEKAEEERRLAEAIQSEKEGDKETAEAILEEPTFVPPPIVESYIPKIAGQTPASKWKWRLKDINIVPRQYLYTNDPVIDGVVRSLKDKCEIPGIEVYEEKYMRSVRR